MTTEYLSTLKIYRLTQEQYDTRLVAGNIDENAIYLTDDNIGEPDWNASEGEGGYIKNRTHYIRQVNDFNFSGPYTFTDATHSASTSLTAVADLGTYTTAFTPTHASIANLFSNSSITIPVNKLFKTTAGPSLLLYLDVSRSDNTCTVKLYSSSASLYGATPHIYNLRYVSQLDEQFIEDKALLKNNPSGTGSFSLNRATDSAIGLGSFAEGYNTVAQGSYSHAEGYQTTALSSNSHAAGKYNIVDAYSTYAHIIGNGTAEFDYARSNAHTLDWDGNATFAGSVTGPGADYAEHFEWLDGNPNAEDRVGTIVTLEGDKIRPANIGDEILGVVSGTAMVIGDNAEWEWHGRFLTDNYGRVITEMVEEFMPVENPETREIEQVSMGFFPHRKLNPNYDPEQEYIRRSDRPEWDVVGLFGKLHVNDDGSCMVGGYATVGLNGVAMASTEKTNMRVMKRITDNIVLVFMK